MSKISSRFICQECGAVLPKWMGQCDICKAWNSVIEEVIQVHKTEKNPTISDDFFTMLDDDINCNVDVASRHKTQLEELNRVLGGGFVDGSVVLLGGPPGIGKSTLLLQMLSFITDINNYIYVSAEESVGQVLLRAKRLGIENKNLKLASTNNITHVISGILDVKNNSIIVMDSIQTVSTELIQSPAGTISQIRFCTQELIDIAKKNNIIVIIIGHITKDGAIAGPKTLEHMVDCVLYFEGDRSFDYRILRVSKNRFGPTDEIGVFSMTENGLEEVSNPSAAFLGDSNEDEEINGTAVFAGVEGTRPILSEIQALVSNTNITMPRRSSNGFDPNRLSMLVAVLSNRCKLQFANKDVYLNVAGGLKILEPAVDLAVIAAIISSYFQKPPPLRAVFFGEVSLSGDIRASHLSFSRIKEASKLGFTRIFCSHKTEIFEKDNQVKIEKLKNIKQLLDIIRKC